MKKCGICKGRGFTNEAVPAGDGINVRFDPPVMIICECSGGPAVRRSPSDTAEQRG